MTDEEFARIVQDTKGYVLSAIEHNLPERFLGAIDDVVQETYLRAYRHLEKGKFREESALSTWLYSIARNESLRMAGKLGREEKRSGGELNEEITTKGEPLFDHDRDALQDAIDRLPESYRGVMKRVALGLSEQEIALEMSLRPGTVKSRAHRGREMLRRMLEERV
jgi:RNA polymerase sigma-70 factor (ECF subfamily)